ncbi:hypothetical protein ACP4OV_015495 [Aristida adscensionis]
MPIQSKAIGAVVLMSFVYIALTSAAAADAAPTRPPDVPVGPAQVSARMSCMECLIRCCVAFGSPPEPCRAFCDGECAASDAHAVVDSY